MCRVHAKSLVIICGANSICGDGNGGYGGGNCGGSGNSNSDGGGNGEGSGDNGYNDGIGSSNIATLPPSPSL